MTDPTPTDTRVIAQIEAWLDHHLMPTRHARQLYDAVFAPLVAERDEALALAAPAAQPDETGWMVDQRVEWNPTEGQWVPATIALVSADEEIALIMRADNLQYLNVLTRHLRPAGAVSAAPARSVAHSEAADRDEAVERAQPDDDVPCQVCGRLFTSVVHDCCERLVDAHKTIRTFIGDDEPDIVEAVTKAVYDADDHDYSEGAAIGRRQEKPYLENDYDRYEGMARAALAALREGQQ